MSEYELFADALWQYHATGRADLFLEREDGYVGKEDVGWYFTGYRDFQTIEKRALKFAAGHVLDAGCGAGRHSLYLQRRGLNVTALDFSRRIVDLARARGVRDVRVVNLCGALPFHEGEFDTVILFGNNLGVCGTPRKFTRMLRELHRITSARAHILATTRMPSALRLRHRVYLENNSARGRALGQIRLRLIHNAKHGAWFDLLLFAPPDLLRLAARTGWRIAEIFTEENFADGYSVVLEKW